MNQLGVNGVASGGNLKTALLKKEMLYAKGCPLKNNGLQEAH